MNDTTPPTQATVSYQVKNQYGEDITKTTALTTNSAAVSAANGVATVSLTNEKVGDKLPITLIHVESAKSATKVVTLSAAATVSDVEIKGIYNKDGKALNEDSKVADGYYLLVDLKDQYGNALTNTSAASGLIVAESNPTVVGLEGTAPAVTLTQLTIDGKKQLAVKLDAISKAGESQVTLISKTSGKSAAYKVNVAETTRADVVQLSAPALAVANEDVYIPASVLDKEGKAITDPKVLNNDTKGVTLNLGAEFVTKDEALFVKVPKAQVATKGVYSLLAQSATNKVATLTINVKEEAEATVIRGLKSTVSSTIKAGASKTIDASDLVVEDQYGRVIDSADVKASLTGGKKIVVKKADVNAPEITIDAANITDAATAEITAGSANGTETLQFVLNDGSKDIVSSTAEVTVRVTDGSEYASYEVKPVGTVYDEKGAGATTTDATVYNKEVEVYGVLADGSKVKLVAGNDYAVSSTNATLKADVSTDGVINADGDVYQYATDAKTITLPLTVTINATGEKLNQEVTFSKVAPKVEKVNVVADGKADDKTATALEKFDFNATTAFAITDFLTNADVVVTDQYGAKVNLNATGNAFADGTGIANPTLTFTKVSGNVTFAGNGTAAATVTTKEENSVFNTTVSVSAVDATPVKVTSKQKTL
ncbi:hypothetical protein [Bacillus sp. FJAT-42315]|uniref:hypothetical protein n=1 Tax=Bacillus sp. FJAT-42315 TaxID=2014077 RepID=UPI000C23523A|nr:hypothetical protein [Bacillus sp. FJAT-42315]